jgi:SAM-dependent methyltransferase
LREGYVDVALACWMLYHVDPARTLPGVARALRPGGCLIATTNDESLLPGLEDDVDAAASEVAGREVHAPLGRLRFNVANGREVLSPYFDEVEEIVDAVDYEMPDASPLITFAKSVRGPVLASLGADFDFDAFLDVMGRRVEARFAGGPIRMTRRSAFFVARA